MNALATTPTSAAGAKTYMLSGGSAFAPPPLHTADFNHLAYNPNVTYTAPVKADGTPVTNTGTDANGNYGTTSTFWNTASVDRDPYSAYETAAGVTPMWSAATKDNMSLKMAVPLYCNTDWPLLVNDAYWPGGPNGATALDAGTTNGQYSAGTGGWCRINGTKYDLSAASGAPAAADDYNYPWQSSSGATGALFLSATRHQDALVRQHVALLAEDAGSVDRLHRRRVHSWNHRTPILQALELRRHVHGFLPGADVQGHRHQHDVLRCQRDVVLAAGNRKLAGVQGVYLRPQYAEGQRRLSPDLDWRRRVRGGLQLHRCGLRVAGVSQFHGYRSHLHRRDAGLYVDRCGQHRLQLVALGPRCRCPIGNHRVDRCRRPRHGGRARDDLPPQQLHLCSGWRGRIVQVQLIGARLSGRRRRHRPQVQSGRNVGLPRCRYDGANPTPLLCGRLGTVLQRPHRRGGHAVEGLRHRCLPGQERPVLLQGRQIRQVHACRRVPRQHGSVPRQLQSGGQRHPVSERSRLARRRHPGPGQLRSRSITPTGTRTIRRVSTQPSPRRRSAFRS